MRQIMKVEGVDKVIKSTAPGLSRTHGIFEGFYHIRRPLTLTNHRFASPPSFRYTLSSPTPLYISPLPHYTAFRGFIFFFLRTRSHALRGREPQIKLRKIETRRSSIIHRYDDTKAMVATAVRSKLLYFFPVGFFECCSFYSDVGALTVQNALPQQPSARKDIF